MRLGRDVELAALPLVKQWPGESGPAITGGQLVTADRGAEHRAVTLCPLQVLDQNRLAIIDDGQSAFRAHWANYRNANEKMPAAVVLGGDPAAAVAAQHRLARGRRLRPSDRPAAGPRGRRGEMPHARLEVPADAELILEGYVDPETPRSASTSAAAARQPLANRAVGRRAARHRDHASHASDRAGDDRQR